MHGWWLVAGAGCGSFIPDNVASLGLPKNEIGDNVDVFLRAGYFHLGGTQTIAVKKQMLFQFGQPTIGKSEHDESSDLVYAQHPGGQGVVRSDNDLAGGGRGPGGWGFGSGATEPGSGGGDDHGQQQECGRQRLIPGAQPMEWIRHE